MSVHLADQIAQGRHVPGIFILNADFSIGQNLDELILIAEGSFDDEYQDQIVEVIALIYLVVALVYAFVIFRVQS
jgi:hypothetical protein